MTTHPLPKQTIQFTAKTGFITTQIWEKYFFTGGKTRWRHQMWRDLQMRDYIIPLRGKHMDDVYMLNCHNVELRQFIDERWVRPPPFAQIGHDEMVYSEILELELAGIISSWATEAELKHQSGKAFRLNSIGQLIKYPDSLVEFSHHQESRLFIIDHKNFKRHGSSLEGYGLLGGA